MRRTRAIGVLAAGVTATASLLIAAPAAVQAAPAGAPHLPDLQTVVPLDAFSVVQGSAGREFRYTHLVYNAGPGPLEVQPVYDDVTGGYRGTQEVFTHNASGQWSQVSQSRVPDVFEFHAEHGHFHFPLASFGLYSVAADGGLGTPVALSPKVGFCIDDSYIYNSQVEHAGTFVGTRSSCTDPSGLRGISVGGADEYDYRDPGQAIPFDGVPDGTYWFKAVTDPNNDFAEANESNNETDVKVTVSGSTVTAGEVRRPDSSPPASTLTSPSEGAVVKGVVILSATTPVANAAKVEFVLDGHVLGAATSTGSPYTRSWDTTAQLDGTHWLAVRVTDNQGRIGTSPVSAVTVGNIAPPPSSLPLAVAASTFSDGAGSRSASLSGLKGGNLILALVAADGPPGAPQSVTVTGSGLTWSVARRANTSTGTSEIWKAVLPALSTAVTATAVPGGGSFHTSMTLLAFDGSAGVGTGAIASAPTGAAGTSVATTKPGSWIFGVGNDWDGATARTLAAGQLIRHQWVDTSIGDTFWSQSTTAPTAAQGTVVPLGTTAPSNHQWNLAAVEVLASSTSPPPVDDVPPTVQITDPGANAVVSGTTVVGATAADTSGVASVSFFLDGAALGAPDTTPPFTVGWDTTAAPAGSHSLTAKARDATGNIGTSAAVPVTVDNSARAPAVIRIDARATKQATGTLQATGVTTPTSADTLVAFVAFDGPAGAGRQTAVVSGAGVTWTLVKRANTQSGDSEIWTARPVRTLSNATITASPAVAGYHGLLTVLAFAGADGVSVAGAAGAPSGAPSIYLPGVERGSWVFAVGNDWDRAASRSVVGGQVLQQQNLVTSSGNTFWVQSTAAPNPGLSLVTIADTAPVTDQWNYAAVAVRAASGTSSRAFSKLLGHTWVRRPSR
ncbi:hypothetical protein EAH86_04320 [Pedococcus bigeumensis]|uniref:Uncharacterized protein n=1 Tax=Pedococcus bigeumensis TaxID=433644 RepID=A0A502D287_9MICO|nr:hypothetical protein EAH86_04320 [Pedococcus bigeumensis]